jgi:dipeptidyl aminopeptidase/acylaminoacyl peptidase
MRRFFALMGILLGAVAQAQELLPKDAFAAMPSMRTVRISPDGRHIVYISAIGDAQVARTQDLTSPHAKPQLITAAPPRFRLSWCQFANDERILCAYEGTVTQEGEAYPITRVVAVNVDGTKQKVLMQSSAQDHGQLQDRVLDWTPAEPDTVLIQLDEDYNLYPTVYELNVYTGSRKTRLRERKPLRRFLTDTQGEVRVGWGYSDSTELRYFKRIGEKAEWVEMLKFKAFTATDVLTPIALAGSNNRAYATGSYQGREALWEVDLTDQQEPQLIFSHPQVDVDTPLLAADGRLLGIWYEVERPFVFYTDTAAASLMTSIDKVLPTTVNLLSDQSRNERKAIIHSSSDVQMGLYHVMDREAGTLTQIGLSYPDLDSSKLGRMRAISYPAADGTLIPGYLTVPPTRRPERLPLIVMPHGGPISRDSWEFDFLRSFLVDRGYAVLQMNFRGSSGYGGKWFLDAHQDWGGLTYSDITAATQWAIKQGIADPQRTCIVGWSFGGYAALLGAVRNPDLYRCSVSIAGVSDLSALRRDARHFGNWRFAHEQIGADTQKLREDSPLQHVAKIQMPVLLIHGDADYQVDVDHSKTMASALRRADKPHRAVFIDDATHQLERRSDRLTLLTEIETFLAQHIGPATGASWLPVGVLW